MAMEESRSKKEGLKLAQLASYDDIITDALVDKVYFWTSIRKNRARYSASRGIKEEDVTNILRETVIEEKDPTTATEQLLELPGIKKYVQKLPTSEQDHFQRHLRKYVSIYMPDCPFEVSTTNRYTIDTQEAAVTARRDIRKGELIKYLSGIQAPITKDEEKTLDLARLDFSIVMSSRKRTPSLFLGPARFANHDCDANARLTTTGANGMAVIAAKDIELGQEITVSYGENYFGKENCECLCATCERMCRNGWAPPNQTSVEASSANASNEADRLDFRDTRRVMSESSQGSGASTPRATPSKKRTLGELGSLDSPRGLKTEHTSSPLKQITFAMTEVTTEPASPLHTAHDSQPAIFATSSSCESGIPKSVSSSTDVSPKSSCTDPTSLNSSSESRHHSPPGLAQDAVTRTTQVPLIPVPEVLDEDRLNSPSKSLQTLDAALTGIPRTTTFMEIVLREESEQGDSSNTRRNSGMLEDSAISISEDLPVTITEVDGEEEVVSGFEHRKPGDYTLTPLLLSHPFSRWVTCRICSSDFVQENAYQTREACPRCERHLKLYGYTWPKTDREGKNDTEERIDHRSVISFVDPNEERVIKKGKSAALKTLLEGKQAQNDSAASDTGDGSVERPARLRKRIIRPTFGEYHVYDESPRPKKKRIDQPTERLKNGKIPSKRKYGELGESTSRRTEQRAKLQRLIAIKTQPGRRRHPSESHPIKRTGEIITRTGKPRIRAVRSDKGIPRPERRKLPASKSLGGHNRERQLKNIKLKISKPAGSQYTDDESDDQVENRRKKGNKKQKSKWLGMPVERGSSKGKPGRPPKLKPSWEYVDDANPPPFAAPPSPPPLRPKPQAKSRISAPKAPKVKHSYFYVPETFRPPLAAPPSPPRVSRKARSNANEDDPDFTGRCSDEESVSGPFVPRRSGRSAMNNRGTNQRNAVEGSKHQQAPKEAFTRKPPPKNASSPQSKSAAETFVPFADSFLDLFLEFTKNANVDAIGLSESPDPVIFLDKLLIDIQNSKEMTNPETFNEHLFKDFFEHVAAALAAVRARKYPSTCYRELFSRLLRAMRSENQGADKAIVAPEAFKRLRSGIEQKFGKTHPQWKSTLASIDEMIEDKDQFKAGSRIQAIVNETKSSGSYDVLVEDTDLLPRKRRRIIEDDSEEEYRKVYQSDELNNTPPMDTGRSFQLSPGKYTIVRDTVEIKPRSRLAATDLRYIMNEAESSAGANLSPRDASVGESNTMIEIETTPSVARRGRGRPRKIMTHT